MEGGIIGQISYIIAVQLYKQRNNCCGGKRKSTTINTSNPTIVDGQEGDASQSLPDKERQTKASLQLKTMLQGAHTVGW